MAEPRVCSNMPDEIEIGIFHIEKAPELEAHILANEWLGSSGA